MEEEPRFTYLNVSDIVSLSEGTNKKGNAVTYVSLRGCIEDPYTALESLQTLCDRIEGKDEDGLKSPQEGIG
jgi:hypothetical protein